MPRIRGLILRFENEGEHDERLRDRTGHVKMSYTGATDRGGIDSDAEWIRRIHLLLGPCSQTPLYDLEVNQMASQMRRPLPVPPDIAAQGPRAYDEQRNALPKSSADAYFNNNSFFSPYSYPPFAPRNHAVDDEQMSTLPGGTLLHKGFYDLLALIPSTPSPSRLFWGASQRNDAVAGPRYENLGDSPPHTRADLHVSTPAATPSPKKGRRISKDMVSKPTGFMSVFSFAELIVIRTY